MAESIKAGKEPAGGDSAPLVQVGLRLRPANESDHPLLSNFTGVQGAGGLLYIDFGFVEPNALPAVARLVTTGGKVPEAITGRLACRVALGLDTALQLSRQLDQYLGNIAASAKGTAPAKKDGAG